MQGRKGRYLRNWLVGRPLIDSLLWARGKLEVVREGRESEPLERLIGSGASSALIGDAPVPLEISSFLGSGIGHLNLSSANGRKLSHFTLMLVARDPGDI